MPFAVYLKRTERSVVWNKLSLKLTADLKREVGGRDPSKSDFELPQIGVTPLASTRGFLFLVYRAAMPCTEGDEKAFLKLLESPAAVTAARRTVDALEAYAELV